MSAYNSGQDWLMLAAKAGLLLRPSQITGWITVAAQAGFLCYAYFCCGQSQLTVVADKASLLLLWLEPAYCCGQNWLIVVATGFLQLQPKLVYCSCKQSRLNAAFAGEAGLL